MTVLQVTLVLVLPPLLAASVFCAASETALFSLSHRERARLHRISPGSARAAARLLRDPPAVLLTVLMLNSVVSVLYFVATSVLAREVHPEWLGVVVSVVSLLALILAGEILPKLLARRDPARWTRLLIRPFLVGFYFLGPVRGFLAGALVGPLTRLVRPARGASQGAITPDELADLLEVSARAGELEFGEEQLLGDVVELSAIRVREVMVPRVEIPFVDAADGAAQVREAALRSGLAMLPVREGPEGRVLGLLDARRYLSAIEIGGQPRAMPAEFVVAACFVPAMARLDQVLDEFRRMKQDLALCADEHGAIVGMVRLDDVVRRLVGAPPFDSEGLAAETPGIQSEGPGRWVVPGNLRLGALRPLLDHAAVGGHAGLRAVSTVGGLVFHALGRLPREGDRVRIRNLAIEVRSMRGRRVDRALLSLESEPTEGAA